MSDDHPKRKKSWRDADRKREKGRQKRFAPGTDPYSHRTNRSYKAELNTFFDKGVASDRIKNLVQQAGPEVKVEAEDPERLRLIRKVRTASTFDAFVQAIDALRAGDGLPNDVDVLVRALEHPEDPVIREALNRLQELAKGVDLTQMKSIRARLDSLEGFVEEAETLTLVAGLRKRLFGDTAV